MDFFYVHSFSNILGLLTKRCTASFMLISILFSCVPAYEPNPSIEDRNLKREKIIENHLKTQLSNTVYQSLAFGQLTVYKPESFKKLDSLYALKDDYIDIMIAVLEVIAKKVDLDNLKIYEFDEFVRAISKKYEPKKVNDVNVPKFVKKSEILSKTIKDKIIDLVIAELFDNIINRRGEY